MVRKDMLKAKFYANSFFIFENLISMPIVIVSLFNSYSFTDLSRYYYISYTLSTPFSPEGFTAFIEVKWLKKYWQMDRRITYLMCV